MTANELADAMGIRASIRRQATSRKSVQEGADDRLADQLEQAATMLRQQTQEIGELKLRISQLLETQNYLYKKHDSDKAKIEELKQIIDANNLQPNMIKPVAWMDKNGYVYGKHSTRPIDADIPLYTHSNTQSHPIEQVAMRYDFDGYGYKYIDSGSGSDWKTRENGEFLYTKPFFSQKPVAMMVKIDGFDKPEFTTTCSSAALKHPNYTALYDHPPIAFAELEEGQSIPLYEHPETVEDRESAIYATGYWNGIQKAKEKNETLDTRSYLIGRYDGLRELSDARIRELSVAFMLVLRRTSEDELFESVYEYSKLLLKKASEMTDKESAIYATGYWNGIQKAKEKNETLDIRSYLIGRYDGLRELTDEEIDNIFGISALNTTVNLTTEQCYLIVDAILRKASEK